LFRWDTQTLDEEAARAARDLDLTRARCTDPLAVALEAALSTAADDERAALRRFVYARAAVEIAVSEEQIRKRTEVDKLFTLMRRLLTTEGVQPGTSKLGFLYADLLTLQSRWQLAQGELWSSLWTQEMTETFSRRDTKSSRGPQHLASAERLYAVGHLDSALQEIHVAFAAGLDESDAKRARMLDNQLQMLASPDFEPDPAQDNLPHPDDCAGLEAFWHQVWSQALHEKDPSGIILWHRRKKWDMPTDLIMRARLLALALPSRGFDAELPPFSKIRRKLGDDLHRRHSALAVADCGDAIDQLTDRQTPITTRVESAGKSLAAVTRVADPLDRMLILAAATRTLHRVRQDRLARVALLEYRALSLRHTAGNRPDALRLLGDMTELLKPQPSHSDIFESASPRALQTGFFSRTIKMSQMTTKVVAKMMVGWIGRVFKSGENRELSRARQLAEIGQILSEHLAELRGAIMKIGQIGGYLPVAVPAEIRTALSILHAQSNTPVQIDTAEILRKELGAAAEKEIRGVESEPFATGSLGQAYRAQVATGNVVIKIQIPGIKATIRSDFRMAGMLMPLFSRMFPGVAFDQLLLELEARALDECDYRIEAKNMKRIAAALQGDSAIRIPRVIERLSTESVLTTEQAIGESFRQFCEHASVVERNAAGEVILRVFMRLILQHGLVYPDIQPGNLLFDRTGDGVRISLIDFGLVVALPEDARRQLCRGFRAILDDDRASFRTQVEALGFGLNANGYNFDVHYDLARRYSLSMFLSDKPTRITPDYLRDDFEANVLQSPNATLVSLPPGYLHVMRGMMGGMSILVLLEAEGQWRKIGLEVLADAESASNSAA